MTRYDEAAVFVKYHSKSLFFPNRGRVDVNRYVSPVIRYRNVISEYLFQVIAKHIDGCSQYRTR